MTRAELLAAERWAVTDPIDCAVMVEGTTECVAVMGDPQGGPTPADQRRLPLVAAAPQMLHALLAAEAFVCGFGSDELQDVAPLLTQLRQAIGDATAAPTVAEPAA